MEVCSKCQRVIDNWPGKICGFCASESQGSVLHQPSSLMLDGGTPLSDELLEHPIGLPGDEQWLHFNQLLRTIAEEPITTRTVLEKQPRGRIIASMAHQRPLPLLKFMRHIREGLMERLANSGIAQAPLILDTWYGLSRKAQPIEAIASELGVTAREVEIAHAQILDYLRKQVGREMLEQIIVDAARDTLPRYFNDR